MRVKKEKIVPEVEIVKNVVDIKDGYMSPYPPWVPNYKNELSLMGTPVNHYISKFNGKLHRSSPVLAVKKDEVVTKETTYNVLNWILFK